MTSTALVPVYTREYLEALLRHHERRRGLYARTFGAKTFGTKLRLHLITLLRVTSETTFYTELRLSPNVGVKSLHTVVEVICYEIASIKIDLNSNYGPMKGSFRPTGIISSSEALRLYAECREAARQVVLKQLKTLSEALLYVDHPLHSSHKSS